jgi:hypothetical protein
MHQLKNAAMKKSILFFVIFFLAGIKFSIAQETYKPQILPIPSFNVLIDGNTAFQEEGSGGGTREKRNLNVKVSTTSHGLMTGNARVYIIKGDFELVLGPYYVVYDEILSVPIDDGTWGTVIQAESGSYADVWIGDALL